MHIIPNTVVNAFAFGDILPGFAGRHPFNSTLSAMGGRCKPLVDVIDELTHPVFGMV